MSGPSPSALRDEANARAALQVMMARLVEAPHVLLGVPASVAAPELRAAFLRLTKQFHPARYARFSPEVVKMANEVFLTIKRAHNQLLVGINRAAGIPTRAHTTSSGPYQRASTAAGSPAPAPAPTRPPPTTSSPPTTSATPAPAAPTARPRTTAAPPRSTRVATPVRGVPRTGTVTGAAPAPTPASPAAPIAGARVPTRAKTPPVGALEAAQDLLRRKLWVDARQAFHELAVSAPGEKSYRAMMHYARGREAQEAGRLDEARAELQRAIALDPDLAVAKRALDDLPPEPKGGLFSKLFRR